MKNSKRKEFLLKAMAPQKKDSIKDGFHHSSYFPSDLPGKPNTFHSAFQLPEDPLNKEVFNLLQHIQEKERRRIAEGLHNDVGQLLYSAQLALSKLEEEELSQKSQVIKKELENLLGKSIESLRTVSFEIMPPILQDYGLKPAIEELCKKASHEQLNIEYSINIEKRFNDELETGIFRIIQELLNNIIKHSHASVANVTITEESKILCLIIEDNGIGFTTGYNKKGSGLSYIKQRLYYLNGQINFYTAPLKGTKIEIKISQ